MNTKIAKIIVIGIVSLLLATQVIPRAFYVGEGPNIIDYGTVHEWVIDTTEYDWWIPVTDEYGNYSIRDMNAADGTDTVTVNALTIIIDPNKTYGPFLILDINDVPRKPYYEDPNAYYEVRVCADFSNLAPDNYFYTLRATDTEKNVGEGLMKVKVKDMIPPSYPEGGCRPAN